MHGVRPDGRQRRPRVTITAREAGRSHAPFVLRFLRCSCKPLSPYPPLLTSEIFVSSSRGLTNPEVERQGDEDVDGIASQPSGVEPPPAGGLNRPLIELAIERTDHTDVGNGSIGLHHS